MFHLLLSRRSMSGRSTRRGRPVAVQLPPVEEDDGVTEEQEEEGITSQEEEEGEYDEIIEEELDDEEDGEEGLEPDWEQGENMEEEEEEEDEQEEEDDQEDDAGSMSPTDAALMDDEATVDRSADVLGGKDPICYHCGAALVDPPLRIESSESVPGSSMTSPKISIPLHCEVCVRGIHSQCHISLGGSLPTQEESFVCFHCKTSQHGKYAMKSADRARVSVGPDFQVPYIPDIFFAQSMSERFSIARERFVQVWSCDAAKTIIPEDKKLNDYLREASHSWPDKLRVNSTGGSLAPGSVRRLYLGRAATVGSSSNASLHHYWCPFSADYAFSVLHKSNYITSVALAALRSPLLRDCFTHICYPPTKPYYNKWKPKDRRWRMMKIPFPPSRIEAPNMDPNYDYGSTADGGPRLRSRRYLNYNY